jgi:hypothetical protein
VIVGGPLLSQTLAALELPLGVYDPFTFPEFAKAR